MAPKTAGTDNKAKPRILVVLPYGMCFRNIVLNEDLWGNLRHNYTIDVLTPLEIPEKDALGIYRVYPSGSGGPINRLRRLVNRGAVRYRKLLVYSTFFLDLGMGSFFNHLYFNLLQTDVQKRDLFLWAAISKSRTLTPLRALIRMFPLLHPEKGMLKRNRYAFVLLGHNSETECVLLGLLANRLGISVVCIPLGLDNMFIHGPLLMNPDLLLLWGEEQAQEFTNFQVAFNRSLERTKFLPIGSLIYDTYKLVPNDLGESRRRFQLDEGHELILFPAGIESYHGGQTEICTTIVEFLQLHQIPAKLLIRVRPGLDIEMWERFQASHPQIVLLQHPESVSFDKSSMRSRIQLSDEYQDIQLFVQTLRQASLLVIPGFSTMYTDAMAFGTPSVVVANNQHMSRSAMTHLKWYQHSLVHYPHWREFNVVGDLPQLRAFLESFFIGNHRENLLGSELFRMQALAFDGCAGQRAAQAISDHFRVSGNSG